MALSCLTQAIRGVFHEQGDTFHMGHLFPAFKEMRASQSAFQAPAACQATLIQSSQYTIVGYFGGGLSWALTVILTYVNHQDLKLNMSRTAPNLAYPTSVNCTNIHPIDHVSYWESLTHLPLPKTPPPIYRQILENKTQIHHSFPFLLPSTLSSAPTSLILDHCKRF